MPRVLVTGGTGFIGSHLIEALAGRGEAVRCLVRVPEKTLDLDALGVEIVRGDLHDAAALAAATSAVDVVFHLAGLTRALSPAEMYRVNGEGSANLLEACARQPTPPRVVLVSSVAAAGPVPCGQIRSEADPPAPVSVYGKSKLAGEHAAARFADRVPITIVRPGIVFGPRDHALQTAFRAIRLVWSHASPGIRSPALSWIYVSDLIDFLLLAAERGSTLPADGNVAAGRGIYFAVAPELTTWTELGRIAKPLLGRPWASTLPLPKPLAWFAAIVSEGLGRLRGEAAELNRDKIREACVTSWACSGAAAARDLQFTPPKSFADRVRETIDWYFENGWL